MFVDSGAVTSVNHAVRMFPMGTVQMCIGNTVEQEGFSPQVQSCLQRHGQSDAGEMVELVERFVEIPMSHTDVLASSGYIAAKRENPLFALTRQDRATGEITTTVYQPRCLFSPGELVLTPGVKAAVESQEFELRPRLEDHYFGFWGSLSDDDVKTNESAVVDGGRICSRYVIDVWDEQQRRWCKKSDPLWIMTEADRHVTTVLFASEY